MKKIVMALMLAALPSCIDGPDDNSIGVPDAGPDNSGCLGCGLGGIGLLAPDAGEDDIRMGREKPIETGPIPSDPAPPKPPAVDGGAPPPPPPSLVDDDGFVGGKGGGAVEH